MSEISKLRYPIDTHPEPGTTRELAPGVRWLTMPMGGSLNHINLYLLEDDTGWWIVDTGLNLPDTQGHWETIVEHELGGKPVIAVLCTHFHPDHIGQARYLTDRFQCPLYMTHAEYYQARAFFGSGPGSGSDSRTGWASRKFYREAGMSDAFLDELKRQWASRSADAMVMPSMPDGYTRLRDGMTLTIGGREWRIVVGSGHSPEHACLLCPELKVLLSGDQILPIITSNVSVHASEPNANPMKDWMESHDRLLDLPEDLFVLPAHNLPFYGVRSRLRDLIAHHEDRMLAIEEACTTPQTSKDLLPVLFNRKLDPRQMMMALGEAIAHVHLLLHRNRLDRTMHEDGAWRFTAIAPDLARRAHPDAHDAPSSGPMLV
jgi:glyoxylase-like metal-dependent hydrolase (beta-lactamase superfamily II)